MDLLDLLPADAGGTGRADHEPVIHILLACAHGM